MISPSTLRLLRQILIECGPFESNRQLWSIFVDSRLAPWSASIPETNSVSERVDLLINYLIYRQNTAGQSALLLFLQVLAERTYPQDSCHVRLMRIAEMLRTEIGEVEWAKDIRDIESARNHVPAAGRDITDERKLLEMELLLSLSEIKEAKSVADIVNAQLLLPEPWQVEDGFRDATYVRSMLSELHTIARMVASLTDEEIETTSKLPGVLASLESMRKERQYTELPVNRELVEISQLWRTILVNKLIGRFSNPYIVGKPLKGENRELFQGRQDLINAIENAVSGFQERATLALFGPRRSGKTSVLLNLPRLLGPEIIPIFVDLQFVAQVKTEGSFYYALTKEIVEQAKKHRGYLVPEQPSRQAFNEEPVLTLSAWLDEVRDTLKGFTLFLTLDEFERLGTAIANGLLPETILATFRHLIQHRENLYLLFAGVSTLEELGPNWHSYFINVYPLRVGYLDEDSAKLLITQPTLGFPLKYDANALAKTLLLTRGQPYLTQLLCSQVVDWFNTLERRTRHNPRLVNIEDIDYAAQKALDAGAPYFQNIWNEGGATAKQALAAAAQSQEGTTQMPTKVNQQTINYLTQRDLIENKGNRWRIQVELTRQWIYRQCLLEEIVF